VRFFQQVERKLIEPAKPGHLKQLRPGHVEDEGRYAEAEQLGQHQHEDRGEPLTMNQKIDLGELQRQQDDKRDHKHDQHCPRRQPFDQFRETALEPVPRNDVDDRRDQRAQTLPQPRLDQEEQGEQDQERFENAAHGTDLFKR